MRRRGKAAPGLQKMNSTGSATVELVFAPAERDVYSYERIPKGLAPLGAKPGGKMLA